jgi:hypothetical protein
MIRMNFKNTPHPSHLPEGARGQGQDFCSRGILLPEMAIILFRRFGMFYLRPVAALVILAGVACQPNRPATVPQDAPWVGSNKEGCFLKIGKRVFEGWHMEGWDKDGNRILDGIWELDGIARATIQPKEITRFDGEVFYLEDGAKIIFVTKENGI